MKFVSFKAEMRGFLFLLFSLSLLSFGCSRSGHSDHVDVDDHQARKILDSDQVVCDSNCPGYVGAFYFYRKTSDTGGNIRLCSATLVAKNQILTNKHCIEDLITEGEACDDRRVIEIKFPKTGDLPFESVKCKKILKTSKDYFIGDKKNGTRRRVVPDWAIIEVDSEWAAKTARQPVQVAAGESVEGAPVDLFPTYFDLSYDPPLGVIKPVHCTQTFTEQNMFADDSESPLFEMKNCDLELVHGNSGTGAFEPGSNRLIGLIATGSTDKKTVTGTAALCIPGFDSNAADCVFPEDQQTTDVMKAYYYFVNYLGGVIEARSQDDVNFPSDVIRWVPRALSAEDLAHFTVEFASPWNEQLAAFKNRPRWQKKLQLEILGVIFGRAPVCAVSKNDSDVTISLGTLRSWDFLASYTFTESANADGTISTNINMPGNTISTARTQFQQKMSADVASFTAQGALPAAVTSIKFTLPACH